MPAATQPLPIHQRIFAAFSAAFFLVLLGIALICGLHIAFPSEIGQPSIALFTIIVSPPPPEAIPDNKPASAAAPPAKKAKATPVIAVEPEIKLPAPQPVIAAPVVNDGTEAASGAKEYGTGSGASGQGSGTGGGGIGEGTGAGLTRHSERIAGAITNADYPKAASRENAQGTVTVRYIVSTDGRAQDCSVVHSSGNEALDRTTCQLIEKRFRFRPALNADGRPVDEPRAWAQRWWFTP